MLCIILYNLCVFKELRTVFNSAQALLRVPRNGVTVMKAGIGPVQSIRSQSIGEGAGGP